MQAGADEISDVRSVLFIQRHCNRRVHSFLPFRFEVFPPLGELAEPADISQHHFQLLVVRWHKFCY